ncbi:MAG TPA: winged helix-turn-helix transcriptional regulator [Noviherbaspirillum sp.]|uniref:winged helix-turn-helix transcriptional regulator n=1 Tax=Noviherbaspirillum sp. TaxID=1926288 RepID=UPI002D61315C|nr:winged helix-turn-helix transcriptional regulator [Noviherbaspirillum sp.]HYD96141.1 winged helix-turn-helix transcriptional regulator [Noviherbaspirillum sp.]
MDDSYGQFCTVARGAEALCERWTPLVLRELLCGSKRFNDIHRGVPRMSTSLLAQRLRHLEEIGVVRRHAAGKVWEYSLTESGQELGPIIMALGNWGARWMNSRFRDDELDPALLMWDIRRSVRLAMFPSDPVVIQFDLHDARVAEKSWWLVVEQGTVDLCRTDPGRQPAVIVTSTVRALTEIWTGDCTPGEAMNTGQLRVQGPGRVADRLWEWIGTGTFAAARSEALRMRSARGAGA